MNNRILSGLALLAGFVFLFYSCADQKGSFEEALASITADDLKEDVEILSSDEFEGRAPASRGEVLTIEHLKIEFQTLGLKPGNEGSYFQEVPMVKMTAASDAVLNIKGNGTNRTAKYGDEFVATSMRVTAEVALENSEMIFAGYGIIAPEYGWNDYEGLDVKGKTVIVLVNDPGFATEDPQLFNGRAMTYYGRWTYKYEEAARQGAEGVFIVHETEPAAYGWDVVHNGWTGPQFYLESEDNNMSRCAVEGWITLETALGIFDQAGLDYDELKISAAKPGFKSVPLASKADVTLKNSIEYSRSNNVIAILPGTERPEEVIIYTAHWDHFGIDPSLEGDQIFNGALDNATGTAALVELAEAFLKLVTPPARTIAFMAVTAEEQGLLGSLYYATHPIYPKTKTVAVINMDALNIYGKMKDITVIGYGQSELDDYVETVAAEQGRTVRPDPKPERGSFYRSDHFSFAKQGVPALYTGMGIDHVEHGEAWTLEKRDTYIAEKYHKPADNYDPNWDLTGAIDDLRLLFIIGHRLSMETTFPNWKEGSEFKAKRDADMAAVK
jgi:Zn-dependent M28 family amino/carboxypeptidase